MNASTRSPFMPVIPGMGTSDSRNTVNATETARVVQDYTNGNGAAVIGPAGQVTTTNSPEYQGLSDIDKQKMSIVAQQIRSF